ncbi:MULTISPECIES: hypothetical protein [Clostridiaceae]|uniref:hypothetical protein n=1 Tax=Clostridiaceae TaxID=31979 RepID=UPI0005575B3A|nr:MULTISPECIES: hypothetical protein [Clostridiaceae]
MARVYGIKKRLEQNNIDKKLIKEIIGNGDLVEVITRMETLLDSIIMYESLDSCACLGGKEYLKKCEKIGKELTGKSINEKILYLNSKIFLSESIALNNDGTLTAVLVYKNNDKYSCVCSATVCKGVKVSDLALSKSNSVDRDMPLSYCLCCAGSFRRHLQLMLDVKLKTKEIISSPINSRGEKPCEFVFEFN